MRITTRLLTRAGAVTGRPVVRLAGWWLLRLAVDMRIAAVRKQLTQQLEKVWVHRKQIQQFLQASSLAICIKHV